ncbi:FRMPD3 family protein [Megaselia abdita]
MVVSQPAPDMTSTLLSQTKKANMRTKLNKVRFAQSISVEHDCHKTIETPENILKVFLENGQTKSFKFTSVTTVEDILMPLMEKLQIKENVYFGLVLEYSKSLKRKKMKLLKRTQTVCSIKMRPGVDKCLFRLFYVPVSIDDLAEKDCNALNYFFLQCCNDVKYDRFSPEIPLEIILQLGALFLRFNTFDTTNKIASKTIDDIGIDNLIPASIIRNTKPKELKRILLHFLSSNAPSLEIPIEELNDFQVKKQYLELLSTLPSYGTLCFPMTDVDDVGEVILLMNPRYGLNKLSSNCTSQHISKIEDIYSVTSNVLVNENSIAIDLSMDNDEQIRFIMEEDEADEFLIVLQGYATILSENPIRIFQLSGDTKTSNSVPLYFSRHNVFTTSWNFTHQHVKSAIINFEIEPRLLLNKTITEDQKTKVTNVALTDNNIDNFVKQFMTNAAPSNEPEISLEELMKYIIPPPPTNSPFNNLELPPKNLCKLPPKLPPKSAHLKTKFSLIKAYSQFLDDLKTKVNISKNIVNEECIKKEYHLINHELIVHTSKLVTTSKMLLVSMSEKGNLNDQKGNTLELCKLSIQKVFDLIMELKYSPELLEYSNILLTKFENVLVHFSLLINSDLSRKHELSTNAEQLADHLATFLRSLKQFEI